MPEANVALESTSSSVDSSKTVTVDLKSNRFLGFERAAIALKPGDLVEVRSAAEVLSNLDGDGKLEGLPFMPEMLAFCGRRLRVSKRADDTCALGQPRRIERTVHLEQLRCDGSAHRGCEAGCLFLWKEAWLRPVTNGADDSRPTLTAVPTTSTTDGAYRALSELAQKPDNSLMCQATELASASCPAPVGKSSSYFVKVARDYASGKRSLANLRQLLIYFWGKAILYAFMLWARAPWNADRYRKTPATPLDLQPG